MIRKNQKLLGIMLSLVMMLSLIPTMVSAAEAGTTFTDGLFTYKVNADVSTVTLTAIAADQLSGEVVIPSTVTDGTSTYTVTELAGAFKGTDSAISAKTYNMTKLVMADTITKITVSAPFYACRFTELHLSSGLKSDYHGSGYLMNTFTQCNLLYTVNIPAGMTLLQGTFYNAPSIKNVILEGTAVRTLYMDSTSDTAHAFKDGSAINFYVPYTENPSSLFTRMGTGKLTPTYYYYEGDYIFSVKSDGTAKMYSLLPGKTMGETVNIPATLGGKTVSELYLYNYRNNKTTKSFTMPDTVTTIDSGTFYGWNALENVHLSAALTNGGVANQLSNTFQYCKKLTTVEIPAGITKCWGTFKNSTVKTVTIKGTGAVDFYAGVTGDVNARAWNDGTTGITIYYPYNGTAPTRTSATGSFTATVKKVMPSFVSGDFTYKMNEDVASVTLTAAGNVSGDVTVPSSVTYEGKEYAVTAIGAQAFNAKKAITSLTLPETVTTIGYQAFMDMDGLTTFDMPDSVTSIDYGTFYSCDNLETVKLSKNLKGTMQTTFVYCTKLKNCVIPEGVTTLNRTFMYCNVIKVVVVPASVTTITGDKDDIRERLFSTFNNNEVITGAPTEPGFVVMGAAGSAIETYMNSKGWNFKAVNSAMPLEIAAPRPHEDMTVTVNVVNCNKTDKASDMNVYCAYYDKTSHKLVDVGFTPLSSVSAIDVEGVTVNMHKGYDANTVYARAFVWENETLSPLAELSELYEKTVTEE